MAIFRDSLGNVYPEDPGSGLSKGEKHTAKSTHSNSAGKNGRSKRNGKPHNSNGQCGCEFCRRHKE